MELGQLSDSREQRVARRREQDRERPARARAEETPEQREQRLARRGEQDRERRARARAEEMPEQREQRLATDMYMGPCRVKLWDDAE